MVMLSFDRARLDALRLALGASLEELRAIRCTDGAAVDVMRSLAAARRTIEDWMPRVNAVLNSTAMTSCTRSPLGVADLSQSQAAKYARLYNHGREVITDPLPVPGPLAPFHQRNMEEVLAAIESGELLPMRPPMDANGRANAAYESYAYAPTSPPIEVGRIDLTSTPAKFADFWSDGLPVGWKHTETLIVYRLVDARATTAMHRLTAFDRDGGPESVPALITAATTSGYLVVRVVTEDAEITHEMEEGGDKTAHFELARQHNEAYSGAYFPDSQPMFEPVPDGQRYESPDEWTFTTSASPMKDEWGTWQV